MRPAYCKVLIQGSEVEEAALIEAGVTHQLNRHPSCTVRYRQLPESRRAFEYDIGLDMKIVGVSAEGAELVLFNGIVKSVETEYEMSGACNLIYHGIGHSFLLDVEHKSQTFEKQTAPDIAQKLLGSAAGDVQLKGGGPLTVIQFAETDWSFLHRLADRHGCFLRVKEQKVDVLEKFLASNAAVTWREEGGLSLFRTVGQVYTAGIHGVNYDRSKASSRQFKDVVGDPPPEDSLSDLRQGSEKGASMNLLTDALYDKFLSGDHQRFEDELKLESKRRHIHACTAYGESKNAEVTAGEKLEIKGDIETTGVYGVYKVEHHWVVGAGYLNRFWCMPFQIYLDPARPSPAAGHPVPLATRAPLPTIAPPPEPVLANEPASAALPAVQAPARSLGAVVARVLDNNDPMKLPRVKLQFPWEGLDNESGWAPVLMPHAGDGRGVYFIPEIGDEVLVVFEQGDPTRPYVLGSMWNGAAAAPCDDLHGGEYPDNDIKRIVTKSGNRLVFDDKDGQETMVMATPQHIRITMFEGDQTLLIHSDGDINIHAGGTVHIKCNQFLREVG